MASIKDISLISTRPEENNQKLAHALHDSNIEVLNFPLTKIEGLTNYTFLNEQLKDLNSYQYLIFISTNAVRYFFEQIKVNKITLPKSLILAAIGPTTKKDLQKFCCHQIYCPNDTFDSETLVRLEIFKNISQKRILIIRGINGRETLKIILEAKGAIVSYAECYQRLHLNLNFDAIFKKLISPHKIYFLISSHESAKQFKKQALLHKPTWLLSCKCFVNHNRIREEIQPLFSEVIILKDISPESLRNNLLS